MTPLSDRIKKAKEEAETDRAIMICVLSSHCKILPPDSQITNCSICNEEIIISPSTASIDPPLKLVCMHCAELSNVGHRSILCLTEENISTMAKKLGREPTDEEIKSFQGFVRRVCGIKGTENKIV